jgi:hypothetical protein
MFAMGAQIGGTLRLVCTKSFCCASGVIRRASLASNLVIDWTLEHARLCQCSTTDNYDTSVWAGSFEPAALVAAILFPACS